MLSYNIPAHISGLDVNLMTLKNGPLKIISNEVPDKLNSKPLYIISIIYQVALRDNDIKWEQDLIAYDGNKYYAVADTNGYAVLAQELSLSRYSAKMIESAIGNWNGKLIN